MTKPRPRCSVVIPTYNCLTFLACALEGVRMQGVNDIEILVVDDASDDGASDWLAAEAQLIREHRQPLANGK